ncbi:MAG TPA: hemerythrin domain-containing protein [Jatrophihabitantaceae bacterium]
MTAAAPARPDTREMIVVHDLFRRLFGDLPGLIAAVSDGDVARAVRLCDCVDELTTGLEHHHTNEDELLWPKLLDRVGLDTAIVLKAEEQHERVHELLELVQTHTKRFRVSAGAGDRDCLAATLAELDEALREHMADEERLILPLVEEHLTVAEWAELGERGRAGIPKDRLLIQLGWMLDGVSADDRQAFLRELPLPARIAWRLIGKRRFAREKAEIYGTAQPGGVAARPR